MNKTTAQIILILFNILAIFAVGYVIYDLLSVYSAIAQGEKSVPFDTGTTYLLLMSIFWVFSAIQLVGKRGKRSLKYTNQTIAGWFILTIVLAGLLNYLVKQHFTEHGYVACHDPREISRVSKGESLIYKKGACP